VAIRVYIAMLTGYDDHGRAHAPDPSSADGTWGKALFVLRPDGEGQTSRILYKLPWATYHAYNGTGYGSLYAEAVWRQSGDREGYKVTTQRPGGGTGGLVMVGDSPDFHAPRSRRQCFAHWDAPFIAWLEGRGYAVDYCTDLDLHQDASVMNGYRLLLSVGHDEYWSDELRAAIEGHIATGGNVAFFSGNIAGWCVHFVDDDTAMVCAKLPPEPRDPRSDQWQLLRRRRMVGREARTHGLSTPARWPLGLRRDGGLGDGDVLGAAGEHPLIGYECDGTPVVWRGGIAHGAGAKGTPSSFTILGTARLGEGWSVRSSAPLATMGIYGAPSGGIVFQGATTDWPLTLDDPNVARVTANVLDRLALPSARLIGPLPVVGGRCTAVAGERATFYLASGGDDGTDRELVWQTSDGVESTQRELHLDVDVPDDPRPFTVSVSVKSGGQAIAFGTLSVVPLTRDEAQRLQLCVLLREMVLPGEPSEPLVELTGDPLDAARGLNAVNVAWIRERAQRIVEVADEIASRRTEGSGPERAYAERIASIMDDARAMRLELQRPPSDEPGADRS